MNYQMKEYKGKDTLSNVNWYVLYNKCMELNASDKVKSRMVWTSMDLACDFISKKGDKKSIKNSTSWGNYECCWKCSCNGWNN